MDAAAKSRLAGNVTRRAVSRRGEMLAHAHQGGFPHERFATCDGGFHRAWFIGVTAKNRKVTGGGVGNFAVGAGMMTHIRQQFDAAGQVTVPADEFADIHKDGED